MSVAVCYGSSKVPFLFFLLWRKIRVTDSFLRAVVNILLPVAPNSAVNFPLVCFLHRQKLLWICGCMLAVFMCLVCDHPLSSPHKSSPSLCSNEPILFLTPPSLSYNILPDDLWRVLLLTVCGEAHGLLQSCFLLLNKGGLGFLK